MATQTDNDLVEQVQLLAQQSDAPFPYEDCRKVLREASEALPGQAKRYQDLIPDLDSYFYIIDSYAGGVEQALTRPDDELIRASGLFKNSFFQAHPKYKSLEWMINQINTPKLYQEMALRNQLRQILLELFTRRLLHKKALNTKRQEQLLSTLAYETPISF